MFLNATHRDTYPPIDITSTRFAHIHIAIREIRLRGAGEREKERENETKHTVI